MTQRQRSVAEQGVRLLEDALRKNPPPGVSAERVSMFFQQHRVQLTSALSTQLEQGLVPASGTCGCQHAATPQSPPSDPKSARKAPGTRGKAP